VLFNNLARMLVPLLVKNGFNSAFCVRVDYWRSNSEWKSGINLAVKMGINTIFDQFRNSHARYPYSTFMVFVLKTA
jgi:hypothetical protein